MTRRSAWVLLVLLLAGIAGGVGYFIYFSDSDSTVQPLSDNERRARVLATKLSDVLASYVKSMRELSYDPQVLAALSSNDPALAESTGQNLLPKFPAGLRLRLLPPSTAELDANSSPPLTYAILDSIRVAETSRHPAEPEMVLLGTAAAHVAMVSRVERPGGELAGTLVLHLAPEILRRPLEEGLPKGGAVEIRQKVTGVAEAVLYSSGNVNGARDSARAGRVNIPATRWAVFYWSPSSITPADNGFAIDWYTAVLPAVFAATLITACILLWTRRRRSENVLLEAVETSTVIYQGAVRFLLEGTPSRLEVLLNYANLNLADGPAADAPLAKKVSETGGPDLEDDIMTSTVVAKPRPTISETVFRAYDIRGIVDETLTEEAVYLIGRALGSEAHARNQQEVVIARDGRTSGPRLLAALQRGLLESGRDVIDIGMVPTPVLYWATYFLGTHSGVMLTGSHNPANYNGLKIVLDGRALAGGDITAIRDRILAENFTRGQGKLSTTDVAAEYIRRISEDIPVSLTRPLKLVVDCGNGVPGIIAPKLLRALGHDVIELYCEVDGNFPNHHPDPSQPENLRDLIHSVQHFKADLGLAFDGDGDRLGVVDSAGNIIWPDRQMMLFARDVLSRNPGQEIIFDVKCSNHLQTVIESAGGRPLMWKTGHSLIKSKMRESGAPLAGEMSGHIFFKERWYGFDDALYAAARLLEILVKDPRPPAQVFAELPGGVATPELRLDMPESEHSSFMQSLVSKAAFDGNPRITTVDGLRVDFADRWALIRPSNTTPCLILRFEADNREALSRIQTEFRTLLEQVRPGLKLPF